MKDLNENFNNFMMKSNSYREGLFYLDYANKMNNSIAYLIQTSMR